MRLSHAMGACLLLLGACSGAVQQTGRSPSSESVITAADLEGQPAGNLFDYIVSHRPRWLERAYSPALLHDVPETAVYIDNTEYGGPEILRQVLLTSIAEVRHYSPSEAQMRFGPGHLNGVIQITTRAGR